MMAFTYEPTTDRGRVRMRLSDTRAARAAFTDAEIDALISDEGGWRGAVVEGARILLMDRAKFARIFSNEEGSVDETAGTAALQALIDQYAAKAPTGMPAVIVTVLGSHPSDPFDPR